MKFVLMFGTCCLLFSSISVALSTQESEQALELSQTADFLKRQVESNSSVGHAVRSLINRYPNSSVDIVNTAFDVYPESYREILSVSVTTQPAFVDEFLKLAIVKKLAPATDLVSLAINTEPSYAEHATAAACELSPEDFMDIVRTAVNAEPDSADQIAQKLAFNFPSKTLDVLVATIREVPLVGKYVVDALLAIFPDDQEQTESMILISVEELAQYPDSFNRLVELAHERGVSAEQVSMHATKGGLDEESVALALNQHYID